MKRIIVSMHVTLDGFVAGPNGEMDWIGLDDGMFDFVGKLTEDADAALYGRKTFQMMDSYWPTAASKPNASKHDKEHSAWYNKVDKYVFSNTMQGRDNGKTKFIAGNVVEKMSAVKSQSGKNILVFGSPMAVHSLLNENLIDDYFLFVNPVLLGKGIPMFNDVRKSIKLNLAETKLFNSCGVVCLHYKKLP